MVIVDEANEILKFINAKTMKQLFAPQVSQPPDIADILS